MLSLMETTRAADFRFELGESREPGGLEDYAGEFRPSLRLEDFSHAVLVRQVKEFLLDIHLLMRSGYAYVDEHYGSDILDDLAVQDRAAMMPMAVQRLRDALHIRGDGIDAIAKLLQVHPLLPDDYVRSGVAIDDDSSGRFWVTACEGLDDDVTRSPLSWLKQPDAPTFDSLVWTVNPQAVIEPIDPSEVPESDAAVGVAVPHRSGRLAPRVAMDRQHDRYRWNGNFRPYRTAGGTRRASCPALTSGGPDLWWGLWWAARVSIPAPWD